MKKALRWIGIVVGVILVIIGGFALYLNFAPLPTVEVTKVDAKIEATPARYERGRKIVTMACYDCHYDESTGAFTGRKLGEFPAAFGEFWSANITNDPTHGIGKWSDGDLVRMFRTGVHPSGKVILPMMMLPGVSDEDLASVITFLRSDHEFVRANPKADTAMEPSLFGKAIYRMFPTLPMPKGPIPQPDTTDKIKWGRYLVANFGCANCHSNTDKVEYFDVEKTENFLSGGQEMADRAGRPIVTPNISRSKEHGIGTWSELQFVRTLRDGIKPNNKALRPPMPRYNELSYEEMSAMFAYIMQAPENKTPREPETVTVSN